MGRSPQDLVRERRAALGPETVDGDAPLWGLALSGGGIRSATFNLGLIVALAERGLLLRFDLLSTVSGGGYVGALLGRLFHQARDAAGARAVADALANGDARWFLWWLRANGRYLIPRGARDRAFAVALFLRNLVGVHAEIGTVALLAGAGMAAFDLLVWQVLARLPDGALRVFDRDTLAWLPTPWLLCALPALAALVLCCGYWALPEGGHRSRLRQAVLLGFWILFGVVLALVRPADVGADPRWLEWPHGVEVVWWSLVLLTGGWIAAILLGSVLVRWRLRGASARTEAAAVRGWLRNRYTEWLSTCGRVAAALLVAGIVDRLGWFVAFELSALQGWYGAALLAATAVLRVVLPKLLPAAGTPAPGERALAPVLLAHLAGLLVFGALVVWWVSLAQVVVFSGLPQGGAGDADGDAWVRIGLLAAASAGYLLITGWNVGFLNASSLHGFYRARLVRSYLGAGNARRFDPEAVRTGRATRPDLPLEPLPPEPAQGRHVYPVTDVDEGDDIPLRDYAPQRSGGPVHLINVCLNETTDPRGGLFNQDRRGMPLTVGPDGCARVGLRPWQRIADRGAMTLGTWMAISGAAFAPGLGSMTRTGLAALTTMAGLRLGYWWESDALGDAPGRRLAALPGWLFTKSWRLADELRGHFTSDGRHWYLSDGGHCENTGAYALLAERCPLIVVSDCGADPAYRFEDLENLVRRARIDLRTEIEFLRRRSGADGDGAPAVFGALAELAAGDREACLAVARVRYPDRPPGLMVLVKPNICSGLPVDLLNFKNQYPQFPQQSTTDQFFDEAQWESYYTLGRWLGRHLTRERLDQLEGFVAAHFEPDDACRAGPEPAGAAKAPGTVTRQLASTAVGTTIGLGAVTSAGVALWQGIDAVRAGASARVAADRAALKEIADLHGRLGTAPSPEAALPALAASLVRLSETCDTGARQDDVAWFRASPAAACILWQTREFCRNREAVYPSCANLLASVTVGCLDRLSVLREPGRPFYWGVDTRADTPVSCPSDARFAFLAPAAPAASAVRPPPPAASAASSATVGVPMPPPAPPELPAMVCRGRTVYVQIFGPEQRDSVRAWRETWRLLGASVPPIEDVVATSARAGRKPPQAYPQTQVLFHDADSKPCADRLATSVGPDWPAPRPLPAGLRATPGVIEVWVAPDRAARPSAPSPAASTPAR